MLWLQPFFRKRILSRALLLLAKLYDIVHTSQQNRKSFSREQKSIEQLKFKSSVRPKFLFRWNATFSRIFKDCKKLLCFRCSCFDSNRQKAPDTKKEGGFKLCAMLHCKRLFELFVFTLNCAFWWSWASNCMCCGFASTNDLHSHLRFCNLPKYSTKSYVGYRRCITYALWH